MAAAADSSDALDSVLHDELTSGFLQSMSAGGDGEICGEVEAPLGQDEAAEHGRLLREEINCIIRLRRLKQGKSDGCELEEADEAAQRQRRLASCPSGETLQMQRERREKNRLAAIKCRRVKRERERQLRERVRQLETDLQQQQQRSRRCQSLFYCALQQLTGSQDEFHNFLKANSELVRDPLARPQLRRFLAGPYTRLPPSRLPLSRGTDLLAGGVQLKLL